MRSKASSLFWTHFNNLPSEVQELARKNFLLWLANPHHPSLHFKKIGAGLWSARVGKNHRAVGKFYDSDGFLWIWIGTHEDYDQL